MNTGVEAGETAIKLARYYINLQWICYNKKPLLILSLYDLNNVMVVFQKAIRYYSKQSVNKLDIA